MKKEKSPRLLCWDRAGQKSRVEWEGPQLHAKKRGELWGPPHHVKGC